MTAVVFDMDGILFDTEKLCMDSWCRAAEDRNIPDMEVVFPLCIGRNVTDTRTIIEEAYGQDFDYDGFRALADQYFWQEIENNGLPMKKGVKELLAYFKSAGMKIGLASSTKKASVENHLQRAGIRDYFEVLATGDMVEHSKPEPDIYLLACQELGVEAKETYAIEDSYNGIRAAYRAGMKAIMVPDILPPDQEMRDLSYLIREDLLAVKEFLETSAR